MIVIALLDASAATINMFAGRRESIPPIIRVSTTVIVNTATSFTMLYLKGKTSLSWTILGFTLKQKRKWRGTQTPFGRSIISERQTY